MYTKFLISHFPVYFFFKSAFVASEAPLLSIRFQEMESLLFSDLMRIDLFNFQFQGFVNLLMLLDSMKSLKHFDTFLLMNYGFKQNLEKRTSLFVIWAK